MTLHILTSNPLNSDSLQDLIKMSNANDAIALLGDAVYAVLISESELLQSDRSVYCMRQDAQILGIEPHEKFTQISADDLLELSIKHTNSITWA